MVFLTYIAPVKSTPVTLNGGASSTLTFGRGGGPGDQYGLPITFYILRMCVEVI